MSYPIGMNSSRALIARRVGIGSHADKELHQENLKQQTPKSSQTLSGATKKMIMKPAGSLRHISIAIFASLIVMLLSVPSTVDTTVDIPIIASNFGAKLSPRSERKPIVDTFNEFFMESRSDYERKEIVREGIIERLQDLGIEAFAQKLDHWPWNNIIGVVPGKHRKTKDDKIVLIGAHWDTVYGAPGVEDNGSGSACLLEIARLITEYKCRFNHTIMLVWFDYEESGARGSESFVKDYLYPQELDKYQSKFVGAYILDMILVRDRGNDTQTLPDGISKTVNDYLEKLMGFRENDTQTLSDGISKLLPDFYEELVREGKRGDFLAAMSRKHWDEPIEDAFRSSWRDLGYEPRTFKPMRARLPQGRSPTEAEHDAWYEFLSSDHRSFWYPPDHKGLNAILLTDLGYWRSSYSKCYHRDCDDSRLLTDDNLAFMQQVVDALALTLLRVGQGECSVEPTAVALAKTTAATNAKLAPKSERKPIVDTFNEFYRKARSYDDEKQKEIVRDGVIKRLQEQGIEAFLQKSELNPDLPPGYNIIGVVPGRHRKTKDDKIVLIGAHWDTVYGEPFPNQTTIKGMEDNGSGSACLLEIARLIAEHKCRFNHTIMLVWFDDEERGAQGSESFINDYLYPQELDKYQSKFVGAYILDRILVRDRENDTQTVPDNVSEKLPDFNDQLVREKKRGDFLAALSRKHLDTPIVAAFRSSWWDLGYEPRAFKAMRLHERRWQSTEDYLMYFRSDQASVWYQQDHKGLSAILLTDSSKLHSHSKCYHQACDNSRLLTDDNLAFMQQVVDALVLTLLRVGQGECSVKSTATATVSSI